jgi:flagellum-specific ATP synthase
MTVTAEEITDRLEQVRGVIGRADLARPRGRIVDLIGLIVEATGLNAEVGELCELETGRHQAPVPAEVVGFRSGRTLLMPLAELRGIGPGHVVTPTGHHLDVACSDELLGTVVDGLGKPLDGMAPPIAKRRPIEASPPNAMTRQRITDRITLGVRALDTLVPCGQGQRLGIFAGSGVGKSSLLGMIARSTTADVNVICLVGERGREVREFIERDLGDAISHSVVVCATGDQPALVRIKAALTATAIAEHFRDQGKNVMLMMDSVTRFAMAQREVGLAIGEPPATRGYTPSVFAMLPRLLERSGTSDVGSITGLYTVLVDGDDMNEPIADAVRSILDGHIVLTRSLAHTGHYPAIDVLQSVSRLVGEIAPDAVKDAGTRVRELMAAYRDQRDLITIGAYEHGSNPLVDRAILLKEPIDAFLKQRATEPSGLADADAHLMSLVDGDPGFTPYAAPPTDAGLDAIAEPPIDSYLSAEPAGGPSAIPSLDLAGGY